jgi:N-acetylglucosamine-6-phosphate deacetylase
MAFRLFPGRICLISDALRCCGMPDGQYELGGQDVFLKGGIAKLADGTIAGSATNLYDCMLNAVAFGIPKEVAITAATATPAKQLGREEIGVIAAGKLADFVVCDAALNRKAVYMGGKKLA